MKAVVAAFNQEKALVGAFYVITNLRMELFEAPVSILTTVLPVTTGGGRNDVCLVSGVSPQSLLAQGGNYTSLG